MNRFIAVLIVLLSFTCPVCSLVENSSTLAKIKKRLPIKEWKSFVPTVDGEQIYTVNKVSGNIFGKHTTKDNETALFSLKGYTFTSDPLFPVELGDQFVISNEEKEILPGEAYQIHLTLTSVRTGQTQNFTSHIIYTTDVSNIVTATEKERSIDTRYHCLEWKVDVFADAEECVKSEPYPVLNIVYDVILQDSSKYKLTYIVDQYGLTEEQLMEISKNWHLEEGDKILFNKSFSKETEGKKNLDSDVTIKGKFVDGQVLAYGPKRGCLEKYNTNNVYFVNNSGRYVFIKYLVPLYKYDSGNEYKLLVKTYSDAFDTIYGPEKVYYGPYHNTPMKMVGYFNKDDQRVFVFTDDLDNLLYAFPEKRE